MFKLSLCLALLGLSQCWRDERARVVRDYLHYTGWSPVNTRNLPTGTRSEHWAMDLLIRLNISLSSLRSAYTTVSLSVNVYISLQFYNLTVLYLSISWGGSFQFSAKTSKIYIFSLTVINMNIHSVSSITSLKNFDFHANRSISTLALSMQRFVQVKDAVHVPLDY